MKVETFKKNFAPPSPKLSQLMRILIYQSRWGEGKMGTP